jgi:hypothetical protein
MFSILFSLSTALLVQCETKQTESESHEEFHPSHLLGRWSLPYIHQPEGNVDSPGINIAIVVHCRTQELSFHLSVRNFELYPDLRQCFLPYAFIVVWRQRPVAIKRTSVFTEHRSMYGSTATAHLFEFVAIGPKAPSYKWHGWECLWNNSAEGESTVAYQVSSQWSWTSSWYTKRNARITSSSSESGMRTVCKCEMNLTLFSTCYEKRKP